MWCIEILNAKAVAAAAASKVFAHLIHTAPVALIARGN